jgi:DNA repair exonuclease SbcCD nuclease subunit
MRSLSLLLISDIHMSNRLVHARPGADGVTDRLQDQINLWKRVGRTAVEKDCRAIVIVGDLFDKSMVDPITLTATVEAITGLPGDKYIIPGNHDAVNTRGGRFVVEAFGKMGNASVHYLETGKRFAFEGEPWLGLWPMEYCDQETASYTISSMQAAVRALPKRDKRTEVMLLHQSIMGCEHVGWKCDDGLDPDVICEDFDFVVSGHFHDHQTFGPRDKGFYLGAPLHLRYEDAGRRAGFWVVKYTSDGNCDRQFVNGGCPKFHELEWPIDPHEYAKWRPGDYVRVNVTATGPDWEMMKADVAATVKGLADERGFKATFKHKPLYHHTKRIAGISKGADPSMKPEVVMQAYLDAPEVDKGELDKALLSRIGREALEAARTKTAKWLE